METKKKSDRHPIRENARSDQLQTSPPATATRAGGPATCGAAAGRAAVKSWAEAGSEWVFASVRTGARLRVRALLDLLAALAAGVDLGVRLTNLQGEIDRTDPLCLPSSRMIYRN